MKSDETRYEKRNAPSDKNVIDEDKTDNAIDRYEAEEEKDRFDRNDKETYCTIRDDQMHQEENEIRK